MADFDRGVKASLVAAMIYLAISVILSAIYQNDTLSLPYFVLGTGLTPLFLLKELADPSFVLSLLFQYMIRGLIFGAVLAALYSLLPGSTSVKKGVVLSMFLWIVGAVWLIYVTPGWPDDGALTLVVVGLTVSLSSISLALVSVVSALVFGALTGFLWDGFRGKELREERKGRSVLRISFILGVVYWALLAVGFLVGVVIEGEIFPIMTPDSWWGNMLYMLVVFLGLPSWILTRAAWKKTKADKSGFKWGVAGGVMMMLTGIMLFPGVLAIIGGVVSRRKAVSEPSSTANVGGLNRYMPRAGIFLIGVVFLIAVALVGGTVGSGPPSQDLEIRTWHDLDAVGDNLDGHHILMNHLDATTAGYIGLASPTANQGKGWQPIGAFSTQQTNADHGLLVFEGTFDGQGYEIRDLFINRPDEGFVGLFLGVGEKGVVKEIGLVNATVTGSAFVGSLVGWNRGAVRDSYFTGSVAGGYGVGGLVGGNLGSVTDSCSTGSVTGNSSIGGLVGQNYGTVSNSYSSANVVGTSGIGGVVGTSAGTVSQSYSTGSVSGNLSVGGVMGSNGGTVGDSYSTGSVTGNSSVGGLIGDTFDGTVSDSYSTASVTGNYTVGGLLGDNKRSTVEGSFWDTETSRQATSAGGTGKTTAEMQDIDTFSRAGWNIIAVAPGETNSTYVWNIVNDVTYPFLTWQ